MEENLNPHGEKPAPAHPRYLKSYTGWYPKYKRKGIPDVYSLDACQAILDQAWRETLDGSRYPSRGRAATMIVRIWCAIRPSESDHPAFSLNDDCSLIHVPEDTKTGFRIVEVPPCAQIQLLLLKQMGLLTFEKYSRTCWAQFRGRVGFPLAASKMRSAIWQQGKRLSAEEAERRFRALWPLRFRKYAQDTARHTGGTAYANACRNLQETSKWMGNSVDVLDHYIGLFPVADLPAFYQLVGAPVKVHLDPTKIPLPSWYNGHSAAARRAEQLLITDLVSGAAGRLEIPQADLQDAEKTEAA